MAEEEKAEEEESSNEESEEEEKPQPAGRPWAFSPGSVSAPPVNYQNVVILLATGLVLVNFWQDIKLTWGAITKTQEVSDWSQIGKDAGQALVFLLLIGFFAGISPGTGKISVAIVAALWIALLLNKKGVPVPAKGGTGVTHTP